MRKSTIILTMLFCTYASFPWRTLGQDTTPATDTATANTNDGEVQPKPEELLRKMADYLGGLPAFSSKMESLIEIKAQGMDNKMATKITLRLERPNRFAAIVDEGMMGMTIVSDGKQLIEFVPAMKRYAVQEAPADFSELSKSSQAMPFTMMGSTSSFIPTSGEDFYKSLMSRVTSSEYVGKEKVGDVMCHRLRFLQEDVNWDIFIEEGDRPLPHKVIPDMSKQLANAGEMFKDAKFEFNVSFTDWNVEPNFTDEDFQFTPPADAEKVDSLFEGLAGGQEEAPHALLGQPAPPFETTDVDGHPVDLNAELGKNVIMLDFWATWCGPCVQAMPEVDGVAKKFVDKGLVFYAVNVQEDAETIKEFLKERELEVPVALDPDGKISQLYKAEGIPQTVLIGKDGKVQVVHVGFSDKLGDMLSKEVEDLLAGKDLATEALAKAKEAQAQESKVTASFKPVGTKPAWTVPGNWSGVAVHDATSTVYAAGANNGAAAISADGSVRKEIPIDQGGTLRLANLAGDTEPELITFQPWGSGVKAFNASGESVWEYPGGQGVDDVWPSDLNGDGMDEVVVGYNGGTGLHVIDQSGKLLWKDTTIGNVWHVTAGDFNKDGKSDVVTTSARGDLHAFDAAGKKLKDVDLSVYASFVRLAQLDQDAPLAIVSGSGDNAEVLTAVNFSGEEKWSLTMPHLETAHADDLAIAPGGAWAAVAMRGGLVHVVDLATSRIIARAAEQGLRPQLAWLPRKNESPLLVVATGGDLNAFEVMPTDVEAADAAAGSTPGEVASGQSTEVEESTDGATSGNSAK